jgi:hypothetical protein
MPARPSFPPPTFSKIFVRARAVLVFFSLVTILDPALATSRAFEKSPGKRRSAVGTPGSCRVSARFVEAKAKRGKAIWVFERLEDLKPPCIFETSRFEVWIWQGSYSTLSRSIVYPIHIDEPKPDATVELALVRRDQRELPSGEIYSGWFLTEGEDALKARSP